MKKGVSPIIASVLLIAITVTLGTIIYSFSKDSIFQLSPSPNCDGVSFEAGIYQNNLEINNLGNEIIEGFNLEIKDEFDQIDVEKINLKLNQGESSSIQITSNLENKKLFLVPMIKNSQEKISLCDHSFRRAIN
jgi:flagellin-like protein